MMTLSVRHSGSLLEHLSTYEVDGATVASALFEGGRLFYPGRAQIEQQMERADPYTLEHEARCLDGMFHAIQASVRYLAREATQLFRGHDHTLDLLWESHGSYQRTGSEGPSFDRLVAALVMVEYSRRNASADPHIEQACLTLVRGLGAAGFPPKPAALDELWADAPPACIGLGLIDL